MASVVADMPMPLLHLIDSSSAVSSRPRRRKRWDLEFKSVSGKKSPSATSALLQWLRSLSLPQRVQLFSLENPWLSSMLRQMFTKKLREGDGSFAIRVIAHRSETEQLDDYFAFSRNGANISDSDRMLEQHLRFCDTVHYLDTLAVAPDFLKDFDILMLTLTAVTRGGLFQTPCLVQWDASVKSWVWQCPSWVAGRSVSLGAIALASFEKQCWARFFEAAGKDPRAHGETQGFAWETGVQEACIQTIANLTSFWNALPRSKKELILGGPSSLRRLFISCHQSCVEIQHKLNDSFCSGPAEPNTYPPRIKLTGVYRDPYYSACRTRMQWYTAPRSADFLYGLMGEEDWVEVVLMSPLERAWSGFDILARNVGEKVKEAFTAQIAEDLLKSEAVPMVKKQGSKGKKKKKQKKKDTLQTPSSSGSFVTTENSKEISAKDVAETILDELICTVIRLKLSAGTVAETEFHTVQPGRKKAERGLKAAIPAPVSPPTPKPLSVIKSKSTPTALQRSPPTVIEWPATDAPVVHFKPEKDFPPLSVSASALSYENLTSELLKFKGKVLSLMVFRRKTMVSFLHKIQEVVGFLFPGAHVCIFGSYATRLALPISDLDLAIVNAGFGREQIACAVGSLADVLPAYKWVVEVHPITTASVPVLKLTVDPHFFGGEVVDYLRVDISFEHHSDSPASRHIGLATVSWVKQFLQHFPYAQDCILALKNLLYLQCMNSAYLGGLSSYSLVLWVAAYIETFPVQSAGELLLGVLRHYGCEFDAKATGISLAPSCPRFYPRAQPAFTVCETMDPVTPGNNTTKGSFRLLEVLDLFKLIFQVLQTAIAQGDKDPLASLFSQFATKDALK